MQLEVILHTATKTHHSQKKKKKIVLIFKSKKKKIITAVLALRLWTGKETKRGAKLLGFLDGLRWVS